MIGALVRLSRCLFCDLRLCGREGGLGWGSATIYVALTTAIYLIEIYIPCLRVEALIVKLILGLLCENP